MTSQDVYQKVLKQKGMSEFKELVKKWEALSENIESKPTGLPVILPDIFLISRSGTGRTYLLQLLAEYLTNKKNLLDFYGDVQYLEFMLNYCAPNEHFSEIQRFMSEISNAAGFRSEYRGLIYIDIDEWRSHFEEKYFVSFLEYLSDNSDNWLIVLSVTDTDDANLSRMESLISSFLRIEKITIEPPTLDEHMIYANEILALYGFSLSDDAEGVISDSVGLICKNKYFDGYKTIKMICQDIIYTAYTNGKKANRPLTAEDVIDFCVDSDYIKRMILNIERTKKIGF